MHRARSIWAGVAPHAGAWIETDDGTTHIYGTEVAPHAGAWIETYKMINLDGGTFVAPHAGAWIETSGAGR